MYDTVCICVRESEACSFLEFYCILSPRQQIWLMLAFLFSFLLTVIPKAHTVFTFELGGFHMTLYGNQLGSRASERSAKKFKSKPTIDL